MTRERHSGVSLDRVPIARRAVAAALAAAVLIALAGCGPSDQEINAFIHAWETSVSSPEYRLQPPDGLEIRSPTAPELDGQSQLVRQDGKITLNLVGDVKVAGLTPSEAARKIEALLRTYYVDPQVSVRVSATNSQRYYVFGEVSAVGAFRYTGRDTLLNVLAQSQPTFAAWKSQVKVIRPSHEEGRRRVMTVDAERMIKEGKLEQNILLEEGDIVYVPPTPLAWVAMRLREIFWPFAPIADTVTNPVQVTEGVRADVDTVRGW